MTGQPGGGGGRVDGGAEAAVERAAAVLGVRARRGVAVGPLTTYRVGGPAALFLDATGEADLALAQEAVSSSGVPVLVLGKGSNLLVSDAGFPGLVVSLGEPFASIEVAGDGLVRAGGALSLPVLARRTVAAGLTGMEWAVGVPGSVGGAVRMNAGGHGSDVSRSLVRCGLIDLCQGQGREAGPEALAFSYRHSAVAPHQVVTWASFALAPGDRAASEAELAEIVRWRRENQPGGQNAGSVFTNPPEDSAGRLVEAAGLKGLRVGSAHVSTKHANFVQADPKGSADDVWRLVLEVQRLVEERLGVRLAPELRMVGFPVDGP